EDFSGIFSGDSNWRRYVANSPTNLVDPSGAKAWLGLSSPEGGFHDAANAAGGDLAHAQFFFDSGENGGYFSTETGGNRILFGTVNGAWGTHGGIKPKDYRKVREFDDEQALWQAIQDVKQDTDRFGYNLFGLGGYNCQTAANMVAARYDQIVGRKR